MRYKRGTVGLNMYEWINVKDQLPPLDEPVWIFEPPDRIYVGCRSDSGDGWLWCDCYYTIWFDGDKWHAGDAEEEDINPVAWMPLPQPPKME